MMIIQSTVAYQLSFSAAVEKFAYWLSAQCAAVYFMVMKIVIMCSNMIDINCRQFCC